MGIGLIALALALALALASAQPAGAAQPAAGAAPVMVAMVEPSAIEGAPLRQPQSDGYRCATSYAVCLRIVARDGDAAEVEYFDMDAAAADVAAFALPPGISGADDRTLSIWDWAVRLPVPSDVAGMAPTYLIGILREQRTMYSGGGGSGTRLTLHELIVGDGTARLGREVVSLPWRGSLLIRACFSEVDFDLRLGACHDDYNFAATLTLVRQWGMTNGLPTLRYQTEATASPRTARRMEDTSGTQLRQADLIQWRDPECSYARTLRFNPASERYEMDRPAPDCSSYTVP
jgi:hypothetical protein